MSDRPEPNTAELEHTARAAREQLMASISHLEQRTKHLASSAKNATAAGGWGIAAACAFFVSMSFARRQQTARWEPPPSTFSKVLRAAAATVGLVATGVLVYSAQRRARALVELERDVQHPQLSPENGSPHRPSSGISRPAASV
jgi:heme/copper-type cytochrome/quinol oxidase subunit 3